LPTACIDFWELLLERDDELPEPVQHEPVDLVDLGPHGVVDEGAEDQRALAGFAVRRVDLGDRRARLVGGIDERERHADEVEAVELGDQGGAEGLDGEAGSV
jgi:hypothetical protein